MKLPLMLGAGLAIVATVAVGDDAPPSALERTRPSSNEPLAGMFSPSNAAEYLDRTALEWTRQRQCGSCHTNYPYLMGRPSLDPAGSRAEKEIRAFFEDRVAHWDDGREGAKPRWDAEVVATAQALAMHDAATTGKLHPKTRTALDRMWTLQTPEGGWNWLKCGWPPFEHDDYYGALAAALAVGHAPDDYAKQGSAARGLERLRGYFRQHEPPDLHHQALLLWAATRLEGLMEAPAREATIGALRALQRPDGGWCLPSLGSWKRRDGRANDAAAPSDGYATGLVVLVLREAGVPASDPAIQRAIAWLQGNQRRSGRWFTRSLNNDKAHYITNAGTSFAIMALARCNVPMRPVLSTAAPGTERGTHRPPE